VWLAFVLMLTIFHHPKAKTFCLASFLAKKKKDACKMATVSFCRKKDHQTKNLCLRMMKNRQHQHKGNPHTQEKCQDAAISVEDATIIIRVLTCVARTVCKAIIFFAFKCEEFY
jgi:hypothetical protein